MRDIATRARFTFYALSLLTSLAHAIYVPNEVVDKKTLNTLGIKTLGWQSNNEHVIVHHNYSKVSGFSQQPPSSTYHQEEETTEFTETTTDRIKWHRINDQLTELAAQGFEDDQKNDNQSEFEQMAQEWQTLGSIDHRKPQRAEHETLLKTINDHLSRFDQSTQEFDIQHQQKSLDQEAQGFNQTTSEINDQLGEFVQKPQWPSLDQEQSIAPNNGVQRQKWANLGGEGITQINDHLSGFGSHQDQEIQHLQQEGGERINHQLGEFDQKSQWPNLEQEQKTESVNDHLSGFAQEQKWTSLSGEGITRINNQLSGFGNHHNQRHVNDQFQQWSNLGNDQSFDDQRHYNNDQTPFTQQHVSYYDGRQFTNAHSGGYEPIRSDKLVQARPSVYYDEPIAYKKCPKHATGQFVYELSCNQFLNCWKGRGYVQNCAPGTLFNPRTLECDFPEKVTCITGPRQTPFENREPLSSALQASCPTDFTGIIPHYVDCTKFINCVNGVEFPMSCPPGTLFDVRTNLCDHAYKVECANQESTSDSRFHQGFANKYIVVKPYREGGANATYHRQYLAGGAPLWNQRGQGTLNINDHLDEFIRQVELHGATNQSGYGSQFGGQFPGQTIHSSSSGAVVDQFGTANQNYSDGGYGTGASSHYDGISRTHGHFGLGTNQFGVNPNQFASNSNQYHQHGGGSRQFGQTISSQNQLGSGSGQFGQTALSQNQYGSGSGQFGQATLSQNQHGSDSGQFGQTILSQNQHGSDSGQFGQATLSQNQHGSGSGQFGQTTSIQNQHGGSFNQFGQSSLSSHGQNVRLIDLKKEIRNLGLDVSYCRYHPGFSEHPKNCSLFLFCENGNLMIFPCEGNSLYNPRTQACDLEYRCPKLATNQDYESSKPKCPPDYVGLLPHPTICAKFLNCNNGQTFIQDCGPGTVFNPKLKACDYPYRVRCVDQVISGHNQEYQTGQPKCPQHETGLFPHPTNCSKFLSCANGLTYIQECGHGTVFNPNFKICDYPYRVDCGQKVVGPSVNDQNQNGTWNQNQNIRPNVHGSWNQMGAASQNKNLWRGQSPNQYNQSDDGAQNWWSNQNQNNQWQNANLSGQNRSSILNQSNLYGRADHLSATNQNQNWRTGQNQWQNTNIQRQNQSTNWNLHGHDGSTDQLSASNQNQNWWTGQNQNNQWQNANRQGQNQNTNWNQHSQGNLYDGADQSGASSQNQNWWSNQNQNVRWEAPKANQSARWNPNQNFAHFGAHHQNKSQNWNRSWYNQGAKPPSTSETWHTRGTNQESRTNHTDSSPKHSPPPFPSTDTNADYVFEYDDADEVEVPERKRKNFCQIDDFRCSDNSCISQSMVCDTHKDCPDGKDEINCEKYVEQFSSIPGTKMAVRERGKFPNVTLTLCAKYCMESKGFQCKAFNYRKNDGMCFIFNTNVGLSGSLFMLTNYDYYEYRKFTVDCSDKHKCANQKCIDFGQVCDGVNDCGDRGDEKGCKAEQLGYSVRLVGSGKPHEGVVEVSAFGRSGYICDDMFGLRDAHVLCNELGFPLGALEVHGNSYFAPQAKSNETFYMMDDVTCLGNETSLRDCDFSGWGVHNCMEQEIIGVVCKTPLEKCPKDYWRCETGNECLPLAFVCDAVDDCEDKSDEGSQYCEAPIELRLVGGRSKLEGRVEIKYHGTWGTICDDDFNDDAAKVVCKYLGHEGAALVKKDGYFGKGEGPIWLDQIYCQGNETAIQECLHWDWGEHNCEHSEDVGVVCSDASDYEVFHIEAQRNAKLPELEVLPRALFPERCGYRSDDLFLENDDVHFRVVKGSTARKGDYPWQASLRVKGKTKPTHWCGAVVVSQRFVLTAAHCLDGFTKGAYIVVAGDYNVDVDEGSEQVAYIEDFYTHEQFRNGTRMNNDIALIKLKGDGFNFTKEVRPICLPDADFDGEKGMNCTISGFGSIQSGKAVASKELRAGWIPIQATDVCKMPHIYGDAITDGMICAGSLDEGVDDCDGDSGGPLACLHNGLFTLVGLTSWGQHCGYANKPGVYVKIAHYRNWIDNTMQKHS